MAKYSSHYNAPFENNAMNEYFESLPAFIQETIMQTGVELADEQDLRSYAEQMMSTAIDPNTDL